MDDRRDFDCIDFKLLLTALVDGTAPAEARQTAERHALSCSACLKLLEDAEATDFMLRLAARAEPASLSGDFADRVIAATHGAEMDDLPRQRSSHRASWREGVAWLAAAASLMLALVIWSVEQRPESRGSTRGFAMATIASPVFSGVRELTDEDRRVRAGQEDGLVRTETIASLLRELAETLDRIDALDPGDTNAALALSARVEVLELGRRASLLRNSMPVERRADLEAAEAILAGLSASAPDPVRLERLQETLRSLALAQRLRDMARALPRTIAAA